MANLLPPADTRHVWHFYVARMLFAGAILFVVGACAAALALVPAYWALYASARATPQASGTLDQNTQQADRATLITTSGYARMMSSILATTTPPSNALSHALALKPQGVSIDHVAYTPGSIVLGGSSINPHVLDQFRTALSADALFTQVSVPVSALVGADQGRFTITILGQF